MSASAAKQKKSRRHRRKFTREFKDGAVKWVLAESKGIPEVARDLDLTESALRTWVEQAKEARGEGKPGTLLQDVWCAMAYRSWGPTRAKRQTGGEAVQPAWGTPGSSPTGPPGERAFTPRVPGAPLLWSPPHGFRLQIPGGTLQ